MIPLYQQLAHKLLDAMTAGALPAGARLPSVRQLGQQHGVSLVTALQVYRHLESLGRVVAKPKSGYFVAAAQGAMASLSPLAPSAQRAPVADSTEPPAARWVGLHHDITHITYLARAHGRIRLDIATGPPDVYPTAALQRLMTRISRQHPHLLTQYGTGTGWPALQLELARRAVAAGCELNPRELLITHGSTEALNLALRACTQPGDTVAVESPTYFGVLQILESLQLRALELPTDRVTGLSLTALEQALGTPGAVQAVVVTPNFQNPLGSVMPDAHKAQLVDLTAQHGVALIEDDVFGDLHHPPGMHRPKCAKAWDAPGDAGHVMLCGSATKTLAPGMRIGWLAAGRWRSRVEMLKFTNSIATPELPQAAIAAFMETGGYDRYLRRLRQTYFSQVHRMAQAVRQHFPQGTRCELPQGGHLLWVELPSHLNARTLFDLALHESIGIAPGMMFSTTPRYNHCLRLNAGYPWSPELERSVARLGELACSLATV
jgi:DNA-binding transcriptional MocR family regulator